MALVILDVWSDYIGVDSSITRDALSTQVALQDYIGNTTVSQFYSDDADEISVAARALGWSHPKSAPYKHQSNGRAENAVKRCKRGGRVSLQKAGMQPRWWPYACRHWAHSHNICDRAYDNCISTPFYKRFGWAFDGLQIPFGAKICLSSHKDRKSVVRAKAPLP